MGAAQDHSALDRLLEQSKQSYQQVHDYTCTFHKKEQLKGEIREERNMLLKAMKPQHVYIKWTEGSDNGIEAIYVQGKNKNKLLVHMGGFLHFITVSLDPNGPMAMRHNRHCILEAGLGPVMNMIEKYYLRGRNDPACSIVYSGEGEANGRKSWLIRAEFPPGQGYYGHEIVVAIEQELMLPIKVTVHGWKGEFLEEYIYENIKINVGLTEKDFDIGNPDYEF